MVLRKIATKSICTAEELGICIGDMSPLYMD